MSQCHLARRGGEETPRLGMMKDLLGPARCSPESALHITPELDEVMKSDGFNARHAGRKQFSFIMTQKCGQWKPCNGTGNSFLW